MLNKNDITEIRRKFTFSPGEYAAKSNVVLELCDEIEHLRKALELSKQANQELAKALASLK